MPENPKGILKELDLTTREEHEEVAGKIMKKVTRLDMMLILKSVVDKFEKEEGVHLPENVIAYFSFVLLEGLMIGYRVHEKEMFGSLNLEDKDEDTKSKPLV